MANIFTRVWDTVRNKGSRQPVRDDIAQSVRPLKNKFRSNAPTTRSQFQAAAGAHTQVIAQDYDLSVIDRFVDNESIVYQTFSKIEEKATNNGWQYVSKDQDAVDYIRKRFTEFSRVTKRPVALLIRQILEDLIRYHNCFLYKVRDINNSTGKRVRIGDKLYDPVSAYIRLDATAIIPEKDKDGNVLKYYIGPTHQAQFLLDQGKVVPPEDIVHIYHLKSERNNLGTPYIWPVIDDIRVLRHMEENLEYMIHKHMFPLYQYIIGTKEQPTEPEELEKIAIDIENIPSDGGWVTPNRHDIKVIGAEGKAMDIEKYMEFFRDRIIMGLGIGYVSFGLSGGASRASSEVIDRNLVEKSKLYQRVLSDFFNDIIIPELLAEGGWDQYSDSLPAVFLQFKEIDSDTQIKIENHAANLFNMQAIDYDELRTRIGEDTKADIDQSKLQFYLFGADKLQQYNVELANIGATQKQAAGDSSKSGAAASATSKDKPSNQHGQKNSPKRTRDWADVEDKAQGNSIKSLKNSPNAKKMNESVSTHFDSARQDVLDSIAAGRDSGASVDMSGSKEGVRYAMGMASNAIYNTSRDYVASAWDNGYVSSFGGYITDTTMRLKALEVLEHHDKYVKKTLTDVENDVIMVLTDKNASSQSKEEILRKVSALFDLKKPYITGAVNASIAKAFNYGRAHGFKDMGHTEAYAKTDSKSECDDCKGKHGNKIDLQTMTVEDIPPHHQNCTCSVEVEDPNAEAS